MPSGSGSLYGSTSNENIAAVIEFSYVGDNVTNTSDVTARLKYKRTNAGFITEGTGTFYITINGVKAGITKYLAITESEWVTAVENTITVGHNSDGTRTITLSATGSIPGTSLTSTSVSETVKLATIPRASTLDYLVCSTPYFTGKITYKYTPKSTNFYTRCNISLNLDGEYIAVKSINLGKNSTSQQTATVTFSESELSTIYNRLPYTTKGKLRFTLRTYSDSGYSTQIGDAVYKEISLTIPNNTDTQPTATMTLTPVTSLSEPFSSLYIVGKSKVDANFTDGEGKYGASIVSCTMSVGGKNYGDPHTSDYLTTAGDIIVTGTVTDSRGYSRTYTETITVLPYTEPKILPASGESGIICARCDEDGNITESGTHLKIRARRSYSKLTYNEVQNNFCLIRYRYRAESSNKYSDWETILAKNNTSTDTIDSDEISEVQFYADTAYFVQIGVIDDMGESDAIQIPIPSDFTTFDVPEEHKGRRMGLMRYAKDTDEPGIDVGAPIHGGSVDNLTLGEMITATSVVPIDLNDFKTPGCYYSPSAENSLYIDNTPYKDGGFGLEVREMQSANYIRQEMYYGRTRWTRHWNNVEWSGWVRFLMTSEEESFASDFVTESGEQKGWFYKKWKSGTFEMFGIFDITVTEDGTNYGGLYYSEQFKLPTPFPIKNAVVTGTATSWFIPITGGVSNGEDGENPNENVGFRVFRPVSFASGATFSVRLHVSGKLD